MAGGRRYLAAMPPCRGFATSSLQRAIHLILHQSSRLEQRPAFGWDANFLDSLWILGHPGCDGSRLEYAEITQRDAIALGQLMDNLIEECLDDALGASVRKARALSDARDQIPLGSGHNPPSGTAEMIRLCRSEPEPSVLRKGAAGKRPCVMSGSLMGQRRHRRCRQSASGARIRGDTIWVRGHRTGCPMIPSKSSFFSLDKGFREGHFAGNEGV